MSVSEDLINFDIIETQKENIQSLPQGRSAKALVSAFAPSPFSPLPTPGSTRNLNDAIRVEYEKELSNIADSDDPLDIYDRYVKWTLNAYPSAQATPESQLRPLLERATKAFQTVTHYKNDPRYLRLWMQYIHLFSDAPRETFAYLARHNIGEGLALFYEEFAAWLEGAGRWTQAEEVYKLGIEREARPAERLLRKFREFQQRFEQRPQDVDGPSSPALPTVRPALVAKVDPFASTPRSSDPQAQRLSAATTTAARSGKTKLAIFSDAEAPETAPRPGSGDGARGWDNIGTIEERKKENAIAARPWAGETLKAGKKAKITPKMMVFKDELTSRLAQSANQSTTSAFSSQQQSVNPKTGKIERVYVDLAAVYPNPADMSEEYSFDELRARSRGWLSKNWEPERPGKAVVESSQGLDDSIGTFGNDSQQDVTTEVSGVDQTLSDITNGGKEDFRDAKAERPRRKKVMEVRGETQTIMTNLASPTGPKLKRKKSAEPTMTLHTKAATDDILDILNQPLRNIKPLGGADSESVADSDGYYDEDDYTTGMDSTCTGGISAATSEIGGDDTTGVPSEAANDVTDINENEAKSVSPWSDFTKSKHVPALVNEDTQDVEDQNVDSKKEGGAEEREEEVGVQNEEVEGEVVSQDEITQGDEQSADNTSITNQTGLESIREQTEELEDEQVEVPIPAERAEDPHTRFIPIPPEDYEVPTHPYRDAVQASQARLPFMTPIVEKTEMSISLPSAKEPGKEDYFSAAVAKTPSRQHRNDAAPALPEMENLLLLGSSPLSEIVNEAVPARQQQKQPKPAPKMKVVEGLKTAAATAAATAKGPVIKDMQCNPVDESIRKLILDAAEPPLSEVEGYHDHRPAACNKGAELRRFVKALANKSKGGADKTSTNLLAAPPALTFPGVANVKYTIKRELGKGAFAPVYLAAETPAVDDSGETDLSASTSSSSAVQTTACPLLAIKAEEPPTAWEFYIMRLAHTRLTKPALLSTADRPLSWSSSIAHRAIASIATPHALHHFADASFLLETYHDQGTLLDLANLAKADGSPGGVLDEMLAMFFSVELLRTLEALHGVGIIHGDLKADNCLVRLGSIFETGESEWSAAYAPDGSRGWAAKGVALIDFGRGIDVCAFPAGVGFVADWRTTKQDCVEMREARPWSWQVDYWGAAGVVHVLLFGKWIEDVAVSVETAVEDGMSGGSVPVPSRRYRPKEALKRYWQTELWTRVFDVLLNPGAHSSTSSSSTIGNSAAATGGTSPVLPALATARQGLEKYLVEHAEKKGLKGMLRRVEERLGGGKGLARK